VTSDNSNAKIAMDLNTRFVVEMLQRGFLGFRQFKPSLAHNKDDLDKYQNAVEDVFELLPYLSKDQILNSKTAHSSFKRLTKE
jgi:hypothetical protein